MGYSDVRFPEGSTFLVTGGAGFIGSNLCEAILGLDGGHKVRCLDDLSTGKLANVEPIFGPPRAGDIRHSNADITKARELLGYNPEWSFERGIAAAIEWYRQNL